MASPAGDGSQWPRGDHLELDERFSNSEDDAEKRLLTLDPSHLSASDEYEDVTYEVHWHLRTGWAIVLSIAGTVLMFLVMLTFTHMFIVEDMGLSGSGYNHDSSEPKTFRRTTKDYILSSKWNFESQSTVREYHWTVEDIVANPDGVYRPMLAINGKFPGPLIECNEGDTIVIEVENHSVNSTALHFHGIFQNGTNYMDGTVGVTQCPIAPGGKFRYEFTVSGQSGTYYYHGHHAAQIADGLFGPLVIHSKMEKSNQKIQYATDRVVMVQDYYHDLSHGLLRETLSPGSENSPIPHGALINGMNKRDCSQVGANRVCDNNSAELPTFSLSENQNHRLRFLNVGAFAWFEVSVDDHEFAITEVDGTDINPAWMRRMSISPAQRYSMILTTNQTSHDSFWLRARMINHCFADPRLPGNGAIEVKAIVQYTSRDHDGKEKEIAEPQSENWSDAMAVLCKDPAPSTFTPVHAVAPPAKADHVYYLRSNIEIGNWRLERGFFNKSTFRPDLTSPTLFRVIDGINEQNQTFATSVFHDGVNSAAFDMSSEFTIQHHGVQTVDLIIQNFDEGNHPMHLHGHKFWLLGQGHGMYTASDFSMDSLDLSNLLRRDTASVEGFGWMRIRFLTDNPGIWAFHCHMIWHSEAGLSMLFMSQPETIAKWTIPEQSRSLCMAEGLDKGAAPKDEIWYGFGIGKSQ